jgi:hypothetical protein
MSAGTPIRAGTPTRAQVPHRAEGGVQTVRRVIVYLLLLVMVVIASIGLAGLLARVLDSGATLAASGAAGLAQSLAFALVAGPLAVLLWWLVWRDPVNARDRPSVAFSLYLIVTYTVALLTVLTALLTFLASLIRAHWDPSALATGLVWAGVLLWHRWMLRHAAKGPLRLSGVAVAIGSLIGLGFGVGGAVNALGALVGAALDSLSGREVLAGTGWWLPVLEALVWAVGGLLAWWWHWFREEGGHDAGVFAGVLVVFVAGFAALAVALSGVTMTLHTALRLLLDATDPLRELLAPLGPAVAMASIGSLVLVYYLGVVAGGSPLLARATRLTTSGVSLAAAATGFGIVVNSLLATVNTPLTASDDRSLLLGGLSALLVGGLVWWVSWRPRTAASAERSAAVGRRVYLVVVFGVAAVVALVTLLVIGFRLFEFFLDDAAAAGSLLDRVRAPIGLLAATVLVAVYHFALWRRDRAAPAEAAPRVRQVTLVVAAAGADAAAGAIREATGARVTVWHRSDSGSLGLPASADGLAAAIEVLGAFEAERALVVVGAASTEVIPLDD